MLKKFLLMGAVAGMFAACSDSSTTLITQQELLADSDEISSSDEAVESSSSQKAEGKEGKSSAKESVESSSSEDTEESSSSEESTSSSSDDFNVPHYDKLPFDTAGVKPEVYEFLDIDGEFAEEYASEYAEYGDSAKNIRWLFPVDFEGYCYTIDEPNGEFGGGLQMGAGPLEMLIIAREDSLMYADFRECSGLGWDDCRREKHAYTQKITVGEDVFYYGEFDDKFLLIQMTDSLLSQWSIANPSYVPVKDTSKHTGWPKSLFEGNSLVAFVGDDSSSAYVDTIYIAKYNVKITDVENTWIFENETCTAEGYERPAGMEKKESCNAYIAYHNESKACIRRNLGTESFVRLCRPQQDVYASWGVWCILDEELSEVRP